MNTLQQITTLFLSIALEPWPISSSGHALLGVLLQKKPYDVSMYHLLEHCSHIVLMIVTLLYFGRSWIDYATLLFKTKSMIPWIAHGVLIELITACMYVMVRSWTAYSIPLWLGFCSTGVLLLSTAWYSPGEPSFTPTILNSMVLGVLQGCALLPGISRFGILFWYARWQGVSASFAFFLCFLLGFFVNCAAAALSMYTIYSTGVLFKLLNPVVGLTMVVSGGLCFVGFSVVHALIAHPYFYCLGWYELLVGLVSFLCL